MSNVFATNKTGSSVTVAGWAVHYIDSTNATLTIVRDTNNNECDCFVFTKDNTIYYYVLDGTHNQWVTDLYDIGYSQFPKVTYRGGTVGTLSQQGTQPTVNVGDSVYFYVYGQSSYNLFELDAKYPVIAVARVTNNQGLGDIYYGYTASVTQDGNSHVQITNNSDSAYTNLYGTLVYYCDDQDVSLITVHDTNTLNKYYAFKYTLNGQNFYYVLDVSVSTVGKSWVSDLSSIGYVILPDVEKIGYATYDYWLYTNSSMSQSSSSTIASNGEHELYSSSGTLPGVSVYPTAMLVYQSVIGTDIRTVDFEFCETSYSSTTVFGCKNISDHSISLKRIKMCRCNSTKSTLTQLQDTSHNIVNAFKYVANNVSYYYILDGTHEYWVNDISAAGYSIVLPTVSVSGDWPDGNRLYPSGGGIGLNSFFAVSGVKDATTNGSTAVPYNSGNSYCIFDWFTKDAIGLSDVVLVNNSGNLAFSNVSGNTFYIRFFNVAVCSSNQATVVTVYDSSNNAYNAFKYSLDGTDYYYILDGTQTDWVTDLSSIGYSLSVTLPAVTVDGDFAGTNNWLTSYGRSATLVQKNEATQMYLNNSPYDTPVLYDLSKSYCVIKFEYANSGGPYYMPGYKFSVVNQDGYIYAKLTSDGWEHIISARIAVCSSTQVIIVDVYNRNRDRYNAFKYTVNNKDYYYVLDEVNTLWVDDLESIGYYLYETYLLAMSLDSNNMPVAVTFEQDYYWWSRIPDSTTRSALNNQGMIVDTIYTYDSAKYAYYSSKHLELVGIYTDSAGTTLASNWQSAFELQSYGSNGVAGLHSANGYPTPVTTYRVRIVTT